MSTLKVMMYGLQMKYYTKLWSKMMTKAASYGVNSLKYGKYIKLASYYENKIVSLMEKRTNLIINEA